MTKTITTHNPCAHIPQDYKGKIPVARIKDMVAPESPIWRILSYFEFIAHYHAKKDIEWDDHVEHNIKAAIAKYPTLYKELKTLDALRLFLQYCTNPITKQRAENRIFML